MRDDSYKFVGATYAVLVSTLPDWVFDTFSKLLFAVAAAFLTGVAYEAGRLLIDKLKKR